MFDKVSGKIDPRDEERIAEFWKKNSIFEKSLAIRQNAPEYVFYEGPPTANGVPHAGHLMPRVMKDLFPRYKTMKGYLVRRKGGWDTHGLPVELEVEKALGLKNKQDIEKYGVVKFNEECRKSVFKYKNEWEEMLERYGFWIDLKDPYVTCEDYYLESLWWILRQIWDKGLLYKGHKIVPFCPRCETTLSSHELSQGYRLVKDPSLYVKMKIKGEENKFFLVWTTTPWTLPANVALAINRDYDYAEVLVDKKEKLILAEALVNEIFSKAKVEYNVLKAFKGREILGIEYQPLFDVYKGDKKTWYVIDADFVTLTEGTGIVHIAPAFGEDDYNMGQKYSLPVVQPVDLNGRFTEEAPAYLGMFIKDADKLIMKDLKSAGRLFFVDLYEHDYPFCWRCETPLLYYARDSWFIAATKVKDKIIENNKKINWYPEYIGEGRFGDFLNNLTDWAISRERFWGTPLNIWECTGCKKLVSIGSREELAGFAKDKEAAKKVELHKPFIDELELVCKECGSAMKRTPEVIDCWFDSGCMHTAQWHYPFENQEIFKRSFPADFISEAQDQTRGWFYTLLATSTILYGEPCYKNCLVTGLGLDKDGIKMSKSKGNMVDTDYMAEKFGADAVRWYLYSATNPWNSRRIGYEAIQEVVNKFLGTVKNLYSFFVTYANIDGFDPLKYKGWSKFDNILDKWILSKFNSTLRGVIQYLDSYDITPATRLIAEFVDDLSNWYLRNSRKRAWGSEFTDDKISTYMAQYNLLVNTAKMIAPFTPFIAEDMYQNLVKNICPQEPESVHLCEFPAADESLIDLSLEEEMKEVRKVVSVGLAARNKVKIKVRQPLRQMYVYSEKPLSSLKREEFRQLIIGEINIKDLKAADDPSKFVDYSVKIKFDTLGPKYRHLINQIKEQVEKASPVFIVTELKKKGKYQFTLGEEEIEILTEDLNIELVDKEGYASFQEGDIIAAINKEIDTNLRNEGYARELVNKIQFMRKTADYNLTDRIYVKIESGKEVEDAVNAYREYIMSECLALQIDSKELKLDWDIEKEWNINDQKALIAIYRKR